MGLAVRLPAINATKPPSAGPGDRPACVSQRVTAMQHLTKKGPTGNFRWVIALVLVLGLVALIKCPAQEIPALVQAFGSWIPIRLQL
jgi:hypothetical protein